MQRGGILVRCSRHGWARSCRVIAVDSKICFVLRRYSRIRDQYSARNREADFKIGQAIWSTLA